MCLFHEKIWDSDRVLAVDDQGWRASYKELESFSSRLYEMTGGRTLLFILCENTMESLFGYLGCLKTGIVPLMLESRIHPHLLRGLIREYDPPFLYVPESRTGALADTRVVWRFGGYCLCARNGKTPPLHSGLALLLTTSGSTGSPKLVRQSMENIVSNAKSIASYLEIDENERPITTLPMNYTYGLSIINSHVLKGATLLLTTRGILERPFWEFAKEQKATSFGGVPYTYQMLKRIGFMEMDLPDLKTMTQAGGKLPASLHREFALYGERTGKRFVVMYGQTEATARMGYLPPARSLEKCGSMGIPIPGGTFWLEDEQGQRIETPGEQGELVYQGKNVALGYARSQEDLSREDEWKGILHTGDMAKRDSQGYYYITGRKKRFVKLSGSRVNLDEVERLLKERFEGMDAACVGTDDCLSVFTDSGSGDSGEAIREYLIEVTGIRARALSVTCMEQLPKNEAGKTLYKELEKNRKGE